MLGKINQYIQDNGLIKSPDRLLLAVSGGVDSMVLLHIFQKLPYVIGVAHMNFGLRENDSDADEQFVKKYCEENQIQFYSKKVDTIQYMEANKLSIQMAARELRYNWFETLKKENNYHHVLTAHHSDDSIETIFINIIRGTGLRGLKGISSNENAIRPLLQISRLEIEEYAKLNNIKWREDVSNSKDVYLRNKLRLKILPMFDELGKHWRESMLQLSEDVALAEKMLGKFYEENIDALYSDNKIFIEQLHKIDNGDWLLRNLLIRLGFTHSTISDILLNLNIQNGKTYESDGFILVRERGYYSVIDKAQNSSQHNSYYISQNDLECVMKNGRVSIKKINVDDFDKKYIQGDAYLDFDLLRFPLTVRKWELGDYFIPMGMKGKKKLSDYFIDEKFTFQQKENTFVIVSEGNIVCILGHRIDDRYKITENTNCIYHINKRNG